MKPATNRRIILSGLILLMFFAASAHALKYQSTSNGYYYDPSNWQVSTDGGITYQPATSAPTKDDDVEIVGGHVIELVRFEPLVAKNLIITNGDITGSSPGVDVLINVSGKISIGKNCNITARPGANSALEGGNISVTAGGNIVVDGDIKTPDGSDHHTGSISITAGGDINIDGDVKTGKAEGNAGSDGACSGNIDIKAKGKIYKKDDCHIETGDAANDGKPASLPSFPAGYGGSSGNITIAGGGKAASEGLTENVNTKKLKTGTKGNKGLDTTGDTTFPPPQDGTKGKIRESETHTVSICANPLIPGSAGMDAGLITLAAFDSIIIRDLSEAAITATGAIHICVSGGTLFLTGCAPGSIISDDSIYIDAAQIITDPGVTINDIMEPDPVLCPCPISELYDFTIVNISKMHDVLQGHYIDVPITIENSDLDMGGFDFLIAYDASALAFTEAEPGQLLEDCGWEYFTYRYGVDGNCGDACPSGLLRIIAIAETNNGPNHPSCYGPPDTDPHELAKMKFFVTNDRTFECQYAPIYFFWDDCNDNAISSIDGEILLIDRAIYDFEENRIIWDEDDDDQFPEDERIPFVGAPDFCLNPDPDKPSALRAIDFVYGGIDIVCADSIDLRGDINCNGLPNEIADAVMFTNFFISGLSAFGDHVEASIAASDVNADGIALSVADLVYMVRVIIGDANPYAKATPYAEAASVHTSVNHSAFGVSTKAPVAIGAGYFVFEYSGYEVGEPQLINGASDMTLIYSNADGVLKVLVYSMEKGVRIPAGTESVFAVPIDGQGEIVMT